MGWCISYCFSYYIVFFITIYNVAWTDGFLAPQSNILTNLQINHQKEVKIGVAPLSVSRNRIRRSDTSQSSPDGKGGGSSKNQSNSTSSATVPNNIGGDETAVLNPGDPNDNENEIIVPFDLQEASLDGNNVSTYSAPTSQFRRLKDIMWVRETLEDLTAAEFACSVEASRLVDDDDGTADDKRRKRKRAVDYEKLLLNLNRRMQDIGCKMPNKIWDGEPICNLVAGGGMGSTVYTDEQREALVERILKIRQALSDVISGYKIELEQENNLLPDGFSIDIDLSQIRVEIPKELKSGGADTSTSSSSTKKRTASMEEKSAPTQQQGPNLYVRDDGTVDWDGALQDRAALKQFGVAVWARINGRDPDSIQEEESTTNSNIENKGEGTSTFNPLSFFNKGDEDEEKKIKMREEVMAKIPDTPAIIEARGKLDTLNNKLREMEKENTALLNSAISAGQAVANVNLASVEPALRSKIRESTASLDKMREEVSYQTLIYELERIYTYLVGELGNPQVKGYVPLQDRLFVAEFGLLESQIDSFKRMLESGENIDTDLLAVVTEQMVDFKRRLGIDYYVTGLTYDGEAIRRYFNDLMMKLNKGLAFYVKGVQLFWDDIIFCSSLIGRAAQGYTLQPREVRIIRRTFKDIITFVPVVIILIIPLSPVGHVLVFGAIQRFFPDFFPSCFTEQRQNLLELYESTEYSEYVVEENWQEKLSRIGEAFGHFIQNSIKSSLSDLGNLGAIPAETTTDKPNGEATTTTTSNGEGKS